MQSSPNQKKPSLKLATLLTIGTILGFGLFLWAEYENLPRIIGLGLIAAAFVLAQKWNRVAQHPHITQPWSKDQNKYVSAVYKSGAGSQQAMVIRQKHLHNSDFQQFADKVDATKRYAGSNR